MNNVTQYRMEHNEKQNHKVQNDHLGDIVREQNAYVHRVLPDIELVKQTEYAGEFEHKKIAPKHCPILDLPPVTAELKRDPCHIYYDKEHHDWV